MIASGSVSAGMIPKLRAAADALRHGVTAAHIVDGRVPHSVLMELLTEAGIGTKIVA
jgi:acetylglutamate kinase